jgi:hypothetical protein
MPSSEYPYVAVGDEITFDTQTVQATSGTVVGIEMDGRRLIAISVALEAPDGSKQVLHVHGHALNEWRLGKPNVVRQPQPMPIPDGLLKNLGRMPPRG